MSALSGLNIPASPPVTHSTLSIHLTASRVNSIMEPEQSHNRKSEDNESNRPENIEALARRVYDELRHFISVPAGMENQIYRYGIMSNKTVDDSGSTRMHGSRNYWRE